VSPNNAVQTVLIKLGARDCTKTDGKINIEQFLKDISANDPQNQSSKEHIILLPKAYGFGDQVPRDITYSEYSENFNYIKFDPQSIVTYLKNSNINFKEDIPVLKLREVLMNVGLPLVTENDTAKYKEVMFSEKRRKERKEIERLRQEEEQKFKNEERMRKKQEKIQEALREKQEQKDKLFEKQRDLASRMRKMREAREEEKNRQIKEALEQAKRLEMQRIIQEESKKIEKYLRKYVMPELIDNSVEFGEDELQIQEGIFRQFIQK
jgi:hypothetical protein